MIFLLSQMAPPFSFFNQINCRWVHSCDDRQRVCRNSCSKSFPYVYYLPLSQLMTRSVFATKIDKSSLPFVFCVCLFRDPLQIFNAIVRFNPVYMIHSQMGFIPRDKCHSNQTMNKNLWSFVSKFCAHNPISTFRQIWVDLSLWPMTHKLLLRPKSFSNGFDFHCWSENSTVRANDPVDPFFMNDFSVHDVNYIDGHRLVQA